MIDQIRSAFQAGLVQWQKHSLERMFERGIGREDVRSAIRSGEVIESYPQDTPFPSLLVIGWLGTRAIHVVVSFDASTGYAFVITCYEPDNRHFAPDRKTRLP